ncbi:hypothetical protein HRbin38_00410 [bacterium HR38]|nr:hypothetical protein HRbin38_00410 [bacterium HR38]
MLDALGSFGVVAVHGQVPLLPVGELLQNEGAVADEVVLAPRHQFPILIQLDGRIGSHRPAAIDDDVGPGSCFVAGAYRQGLHLVVKVISLLGLHVLVCKPVDAHHLPAEVRVGVGPLRSVQPREVKGQGGHVQVQSRGLGEDQLDGLVHGGRVGALGVGVGAVTLGGGHGGSLGQGQGCQNQYCCQNAFAHISLRICPSRWWPLRTPSP